VALEQPHALNGQRGPLELRHEERTARKSQSKQQNESPSHYTRPKTLFIRRHSRASPDVSASFGSFQLQFPTAVPGVFRRASEPSRRRSCTGMTASRPTDPRVARISASGIAPGVRRRKYSTRRSDSPSRLEYHPSVVSLSWVPVYTTQSGSC